MQRSTLQVYIAGGGRRNRRLRTSAIRRVASLVYTLYEPLRRSP